MGGLMKTTLTLLQAFGSVKFNHPRGLLSSWESLAQISRERCPRWVSQPAARMLRPRPTPPNGSVALTAGLRCASSRTSSFDSLVHYLQRRNNLQRPATQIRLMEKTMPARNPREVFIVLLNNVRNNTERATSAYQEIGRHAGDAEIK